MDDLFDDFIGLGVLLLLAFGLVIGVFYLVVMAIVFAVGVFIWLLPYIITGVAAIFLGYVGYLLVLWIIERCKPSAEEQIEALLRDTKSTMECIVKDVA